MGAMPSSEAVAEAEGVHAAVSSIALADGGGGAAAGACLAGAGSATGPGLVLAVAEVASGDGVGKILALDVDLESLDELVRQLGGHPREAVLVRRDALALRERLV